MVQATDAKKKSCPPSFSHPYPPIPKTSLTMDSPNLSTMMASYWPQNTQEALSLLRDRSINMRTPSDAMPDSAAQFFDTIDTLPRLFAACDTFDLVSDAVEKAADGGVKKAWTRATSCNMPELSKWTARSLPDWLRLVNYPVLNAVFGESEMNGLITSSTNKVWLAIEEPWSASAWPSTWSTYPRYTRGLPGSRTEVVYGLPYGPSSNPINHQMSSLRDLDSLSRLALDKLQQRHWPSLRFTPCSENDEETPLFPGIIYAAQASELDMCKSEIRAAAAAAKALQLLENLMRTSDLMSSSPVVAIVVSAGPLWRIHFATSSVVGGDIDKPSYVSTLQCHTFDGALMTASFLSLSTGHLQEQEARLVHRRHRGSTPSLRDLGQSRALVACNA